MGRQFVAIMNPVSGRRSKSPAVEVIGHALQRAGASLEIAVTQQGGDATAIASQLPLDVEAILVIGGDGTVSEVVNGLVERSTPIVILRTGTENLLARELGMPKQPSRIAETLLHGESFEFDIGVINQRRFAAMVGVGLDAECVRRMAEARRGHISHLDYIWPIWRSFWSYRFPTLRIQADGECIFEGRGLAIVGTIRRYGGGLHVLANARYDDGLLDLCIFQCSSRIELFAHVCRAFLRRHVGHHQVLYRQCKNIHVASPEAVPIQIDGDVGGSLPATCSLLAGAARFLRLPAERNGRRPGGPDGCP